MRSLMAWAGAIAVAWHTVLGCCAHHDHDHGAVQAAEPAAAKSCAHGHKSHAGHRHEPVAQADLPADGSLPGDEAPTSSGHAPDGDCTEQDCVFAAPALSGAAEWLTQDLPCWEGHAPQALCEQVPALSAADYQRPERLLQPHPSLRAHLALSILLI